MPRLSLIVCRYDATHFARLRDNLEATLTTAPELVVVDNRDNRHDLFSAYNEGLGRATGELLCFLHEDLTFPEAGWDARAVAHFDADAGLGMIGVAGGRSLHVLPRSWKHTYHPGDYAQALTEPDGSDGVYGLGPDGRRQVLLLDGLWMCVRRRVVEAHGLRFDEGHFRGFHRYDYDFSLQVARYARVAVVGDVRPLHHSYGRRDKAWLRASADFQRKWNDVLPCTLVEGGAGIRTLPWTRNDYLAVVRFALNMRKLGCGRREIDGLLDVVLGARSRKPYELRLAECYARSRGVALGPRAAGAPQPAGS